MADSDALRSRRKRLHAAGDHRLCRRCSARGSVSLVPPAGGGAVDRQASLEALARRLEAAHEAAPDDAAVARELRATLLALPAAAGDDPLAEVAALAADVP